MKKERDKNMKDIRFLKNELKMRERDLEDLLNNSSSEFEIYEFLEKIIKENEEEFNHLYLINHDDKEDIESFEDYIERLIYMIIDREIKLSEIF